MYMLPAFENRKPQIHHPVSKKRIKKPVMPKRIVPEPAAPTFTKIVPINPFASWIMPPRQAPYIKPKERGDCL